MDGTLCIPRQVLNFFLYKIAQRETQSGSVFYVTEIVLDCYFGCMILPSFFLLKPFCICDLKCRKLLKMHKTKWV